MKTTSLRIISSTPNSFGQRSNTMLVTLLGMLLVATALSLSAQPASSSAAGGLVGHWNFDEGSGSVTADSSGFGNDGQLAEGTTWWQSPSLARVALFFDGANDHVKVRNSPSLNPSDEITLAAWIAPYDLSGSGEIIAKSNGTDPQYYLRVQAGGKIRFGIGGTVLNGNTTLSPSQWHHVAGTYDGSTMKIYVDGGVDAVMNKNGPMHDNGVDVWIGCRRFRTPLAFNGVIDDPQVYSRALSANEIQALATPGQVVITSINNQTFIPGIRFGGGFIDLTIDFFNFVAPVAKVEYYEGSTLIGTATQAPYDIGLHISPDILGPPRQYIDAVATDTLGNVVTTASGAFWYNICADAIYNPPYVQIISPASRSVFADGDPILIQVLIWQPCGGMFDGIDLLGLPFPVHLAGTVDDFGFFQFVWENAPLGFHSISARTSGPGPYSFDADPVDINVVANHLGRPANDDFADSFDLAQITTGNNLNATREPGEPNHTPSAGHSVWWHWTAPSDGWVVFSTEGSSFDAGVVIYTGNNVGNLNDTISGNLFFSSAGTTYQILVDGVPGALGNIQLNVHYDVPPTVSLISPRNGDVFPQGTPIHFEATASDSDGSIARVRYLITGGLDDFVNQTFVVDASPFAFDWTPPLPGQYFVLVCSVDNDGFETCTLYGEVSFTVQGSRPLVRITSPADRQIFDAGTTSITFQTATSVSDGFIAKVDFYLDSVGLVGTVTSAPFEFTWSPTTPCVNGLTVIATDNFGVSSVPWEPNSIGIAYFAVEPNYPESPAINMVDPQDGASFSAGQAIPISALPSNYCRPPDQVEFYALTPTNTKTLLGAVPGVFLPGCCFYHWMYWTDATPGDYDLTARAVFGSNFVDSPGVHITVTP